jgi:hypothetical protein
MVDLAKERADLAKADADIAEGETRIEEQRRAIEKLRSDGHNTAQAEGLLEVLMTTLNAWRDHRALIVERLERQA